MTRRCNVAFRDKILNDHVPSFKNDSTELNLMEIIYLLSLNNSGASTISVNLVRTSLSLVLRGGLLIELALLGMITLEQRTPRNSSILTRKVIFISSQKTGDLLLDTTLAKIQKCTNKYNVSQWLNYLSGSSFNIFNVSFQITYMRQKIAKSLVEKGYLQFGFRSLFNMSYNTFDLRDRSKQEELVNIFHKYLSTNASNFSSNFKDRNSIAIILAHFGEAMFLVLNSLTDAKYNNAMSCLKNAIAENFQLESNVNKNESEDIMWAVLQCLKGELSPH
uniref:WAPL domain-containing protein n=1 Tax=Rhabditophanes sp. KR3021 TaxID=114890 RepID=A0AC35THS3_9BILA